MRVYDDGMIYNALLVIIKESCVTNAFLDPPTIGLLIEIIILA